MHRCTVNFGKDKFRIFAPIYLNSIIMALPSRRFLKKDGCWTAPVIGANIQHMRENFGAAKFSDMAIAAINKFKKDLIESLDGNPWPEDFTFKTKPRQHQQRALNKIHPLEAFALLMDMRTGKTKVVIDTFTADYISGKIQAVMVICPLSIRSVWVDELSTHCIKNPNIMFLDTKSKECAAWVESPPPFPWLIAGIESFSAGKGKVIAEKFAKKYDGKIAIVVDESSRIKNHKAGRTEVCVNLSKYANRRGIMTGTPISQGPLDLYSQYEFLNPNIIGVGDFFSFRNKYATMGGYNDKVVVSYKNLEELTKILDPYTFQVRKHEVVEVVPPTMQIRKVSMNPEQKKMYKQFAALSEKEKGEFNGKEMSFQNAMEKILRLHQISGGFYTEKIDNPDLFSRKKFLTKSHKIPGNNPKIAEVVAICEDCDDSIVIWCAYKPEIVAVVQALKGKFGEYSVVEIHGGIDEENRAINRKKFQLKESRFLVGNVATGGMGLKLSTGDVMIYYSNTRKYEDRRQSEERIWAMEKTTGGMFIDLQCIGTVDIIYKNALDNKQDVDEYVRGMIGGGEGINLIKSDF